MRGSLGGGTASISGVTLVLAIVLVPTGTSAYTTSGPSLHPPFSGTWSRSIVGGLLGCGVGSLHDGAHSFNATAGTARLLSRSFGSNRGCVGLPGYTTVNGSTIAEFVATPIRLAAGLHDVVARWSINWTEEVNETIRSRGNLPSACVELTLTTSVRNSNGTGFTNFYNEWGPAGLCLNRGNSTLSGHSRFSLSNNISLSSGGRYSFVADLTAWTGVYIDGPGNTASATCNIGTDGNSARLLSVTIS